MCGRFSLSVNPKAVAEQFGLELQALGPYAPRYNIAPSQPVAAIRALARGAQREWTHFQWGLVPAWAKDPSIVKPMINARGETLAEKPSFRSAFKRRRILVPADGFYEWRKEGPGKVPYHIRRGDQAPFAFAGLWEHWIGANGSELETCTLITAAANRMIKPIHARMPVILIPGDYEAWLDHSDENIKRVVPLLEPREWPEMEAIPVSPYVNNPRNEGARCVEPEGGQLTLAP